MNQSSSDSLLAEIESFCRRTGIAESTFGRQAVNDGKLCVRLRNGKDVTLETAAKIRGFIGGQAPTASVNGADLREQDNNKGTIMSANTKRKGKTPAAADGNADRPFRFYDNHQNAGDFTSVVLQVVRPLDPQAWGAAWVQERPQCPM